MAACFNPNSVLAQAQLAAILGKALGKDPRIQKLASERGYQCLWAEQSCACGDPTHTSHVLSDSVLSLLVGFSIDPSVLTQSYTTDSTFQQESGRSNLVSRADNETSVTRLKSKRKSRSPVTAQAQKIHSLLSRAMFNTEYVNSVLRETSLSNYPRLYPSWVQDYGALNCHLSFLGQSLSCSTYEQEAAFRETLDQYIEDFYRFTVRIRSYAEGVQNLLILCRVKETPAKGRYGTFLLGNLVRTIIRESVKRERELSAKLAELQVTDEEA